MPKQKYDFNKIIGTLRDFMESDKEINESFKRFCEAFDGESWPPHFSKGGVVGFLEAFKIMDNDLYEDLSYYVYDRFEGAKVHWGGRSWNFSDDEQVIEFLNKCHNENLP